MRCLVENCIRNVKDKKTLFKDTSASSVAFSIERACPHAHRLNDCPKDRQRKGMPKAGNSKT